MAQMSPAAMQAQMAQAQAMMSGMSPDQIRSQFSQASEQMKGLSPEEVAAQTGLFSFAQMGLPPCLAQEFDVKIVLAFWPCLQESHSRHARA
jgi:hypothetical protein